MRHADRDTADAGPGVEPCTKGPEGAVVGRAREPGESECCSQESAALVEHAAMLHQRPGLDEHRGVKEQCDFSLDAT